jgi:hypothetical protein
MLIDAIQRLAIAGFSMIDYQYTGMGSIYFFDYAIFHKYLGISRMLSVEISKAVERRVKFNKPFGVVEVTIDSIGNVIPTLSRDRKHILWMDYDNVLRGEYAKDIVSAISSLPVGSMVLVTVDAEPPGAPIKTTEEDESPKELAGPRDWKQYYLTELSDYLPREASETVFARSKIQELNIQILKNVISRGMRSRSDIEFCPMFNFSYKDGHRMLTLGGMLCGPEEKAKLPVARLRDTVYYRSSFDDPPCTINVPRFTRKERHVLDWAMPCQDNWLPEEFEASAAEIEAYRLIYRFLPSYSELLL